MKQFPVHKTLLAALTAAALWPGRAAAQESVGAVQLDQQVLHMTSPWLSTLRAWSVRGDSQNLAKATAEFPESVQCPQIRSRTHSGKNIEI